jgi:hypothetical protein
METRRKNMRRCFGFWVMAIVVSAFLASAGFAKEEESFVPKPIGGEVKYRIDKANVDQYKDKLTEGLIKVIKEWGYTINVYETVHDYKFPKEYLDATEKYKGTARVNAKGGLEDYTAGLPFPEPKTGDEAMYNYEYKYSGDDFKYSYDGRILSATGRARKMSGSYTRLGYQGRLILDPKPALPNPDHVELKELSAFTYPEDVAGMVLLTTRYKSPSKGDDGWMYIPTIRRVRRISVAQRGDSSGGSDFTWDDYRGFSGKVSDSNWKMIGKKELLMPYHSPTTNPRSKGKIFNPDDCRYELRPVWVVEGTSKEKDYVYSKRRIYFDADSWAILSTESWDRRGAMWKTQEIAYGVDNKRHNMFISNQIMYDLIGKTSTQIVNFKQHLNLGLKESAFTESSLRTTGR